MNDTQHEIISRKSFVIFSESRTFAVKTATPPQQQGAHSCAGLLELTATITTIFPQI